MHPYICTRFLFRSLSRIQANTLPTSYVGLPIFRSGLNPKPIHTSPTRRSFSTEITRQRRSSQVMGSQNDPVDLTTSDFDQPNPELAAEDEEDEDLKLAIALSLKQQVDDQDGHLGMAAKASEDAASAAGSQVQTTAQQIPKNGLFGIDRKAMEAERLARLKRKRDEGGEIQVATKIRTTSPHKMRSVSPPTLRRAAQAGHSSMQSAATAPKAKSNASVTASPAVISPSRSQNIYSDGVVLKTFAPGYPTDGTIAFPDLIAPAAELQSCLLSSFQWDFDWLFPHFNTKATNFLLVMHAKWPSDRRKIEDDFASIPNVKICFPDMSGQINCMHSKLMLLFWEDRCRIIVPTANLRGFDWGVGSVMENSVWLIDLPLLSEDSARIETSFKKNLQAFLMAQTVPDGVLAKMDMYDFSKTVDVGFVHSIGGSHTEDGWRNTGHCGLGKTIKEMGLASEDPVEVDFVTSSVGSLNDEFLRCMYLAAHGDDGLTEYTLRTSKPFPAKRAQSDARAANIAGQNWKTHFRFYFPSEETIMASNGGPNSAGTICFNKGWWEGSKFPRHNMRECKSVRDGLLMHNKIIFVRFPETRTIRNAPCFGFAYVGSANLSESAWGRLVQDKSTKSPKLGVKNWECGIVVRAIGDASLDLGKASLAKSVGGDDDSLEQFSRVVPVPMVTPGYDYGTSSRKPWFFTSR